MYLSEVIGADVCLKFSVCIGTGFNGGHDCWRFFSIIKVSLYVRWKCCTRWVKSWYERIVVIYIFQATTRLLAVHSNLCYMTVQFLLISNAYIIIPIKPATLRKEIYKHQVKYYTANHKEINQKNANIPPTCLKWAGPMWVWNSPSASTQLVDSSVKK